MMVRFGARLRRRTQRVTPAGDNWLVAADDFAEVLAEQVRQRLAAGEVVREVARWLYSGPSGGRPITCIKALRSGSSLGLADCKAVVDQAIVEVDPEYFERELDALRREFTEVLEAAEGADEGESAPS
jgi:ribosomal protein L7/L12